MNRLPIIFGISLLMLFAPYCSLYEEPAPSAEDIIPLAWDYFEEGDYEYALQKFESAVNADPNNESAYHGRAWCHLLLSNAAESISDFETAIQKGNESLDPPAGLAAAFLAVEKYTPSISKANHVLANNPNYYFEHKPLINYQDMHLILAMAYFHEGELTKSQEHVTVLYQDHGLNPADSSTWQFNQQSYASYPEALMAVIDYLDVLYGM